MPAVRQHVRRAHKRHTRATFAVRQPPGAASVQPQTRALAAIDMFYESLSHFSVAEFYQELQQNRVCCVAQALRIVLVSQFAKPRDRLPRRHCVLPAVIRINDIYALDSALLRHPVVEGDVIISA